MSVVLRMKVTICILGETVIGIKFHDNSRFFDISVRRREINEIKTVTCNLTTVIFLVISLMAYKVQDLFTS